MVETTKELAELVQEKYVPTAVERKKAVLMYFFVWVMIWLSKKYVSKYELFHLKQSCWWWAIFFILFVVSIFMFFIPYVRLLPVIIFAIMMIIWLIFIKQAREWFYLWENEKVLMPVFMWLWTWILDIFDLNSDGELEQIVDDDQWNFQLTEASDEDSDVVDEAWWSMGN